MDVLKGVQGHSRTLILSHAIRHLLDHQFSEAFLGDVAAVDLLQACMSDHESDIASDRNSLAERPPASFVSSRPEWKNQPEDDFLVLSSGHQQRVLGEIAIDRAALQRVLEENPLSLTSLLEALLRALDGPVPEQAEYSPTQPEVVGQMA